MRHDMSRVIIDVARSGSRYKPNVSTRLGTKRVSESDRDVDVMGFVDFEGGGEEVEFGNDSPTRISRRHRMMASHRGHNKGQSDRLQPLLRFLRKQVGCPWDQVWSDICHHADQRSVDGNHIRDHVRQLVCIAGQEFNGYAYQFLVDSEGVLQNQPKSEPFKLKPEPVEEIEVSEAFRLKLLKGFWFEVRYEKITYGPSQVMNYIRNTPVVHDIPGGVRFEEVSRRQIGRKSLRALRQALSNGLKENDKLNLKKIFNS